MDRSEIVKVAEAALRYIDAIPKDIGNALPAMPGFDRDWADEVIAKSSPLNWVICVCCGNPAVGKCEGSSALSSEDRGPP